MVASAVVKQQIPSTYFDIDMSTFYKVGELFFGERYEIMHNNVVISKDKSIRIAIKEFEKEMTEYSELYISNDSIRICEALDYMGKNIFDEVDPELQGWLVFLNPYIFLNWEHPCKYLFIINQDYIEKKEYNRGFKGDIPMKLIKQGV